MKTSQAPTFRGLGLSPDQAPWFVPRVEDELLVVYVTAPADAAQNLAQLLVSRQLAACVNLISSVQSVYRWQGAVESATETLMMIKTPRSGFEQLRAAVVEHHPYDTPEVIGFKVDSAHQAYADWVKGAVEVAS